MKNLIIAIALILISISTSNVFAGSQPAKPYETRRVVTKTTIHCVQFHEYYSEYYKEVYDSKGNLINVIDGKTVYVYYTYEYKFYPVYPSDTK